MTSILRQLLKLITDSIDGLEAACEASGHQLPDLHELFSLQSEGFRADPHAAEAARVICAAALHMEAILMPPHISFYHLSNGYARSAALRICLESNVTEILREAGPSGLHVDQIASKAGQDSKMLARFLRYLATHHCYREIAPNVFTNTRISSMMDTLKSSQEIIDNPGLKYNDLNTNCLAALASFQLDEVYKGASLSWETFSDPETAKSGEAKAAPIARAFCPGETMWDFHAREEQRARRFNIAMKGMQAFESKDAFLKAYDWDHLPENSVVVDVAGGVGNESIPLARAFPKFDVVIQDRAPVIEDAKKLWKDELSSTRVTLEVHDFFKPQPKDRKVSIFLLKQITHNWSDEFCVKILSHLRAAAEKDTKLVVIESLMPYACHDPNNDAEHAIAGTVIKEAPKPLLANYGVANGLAYNLDFSMFVLFNAQERTIYHMEELLRRAGWLVNKLRRHNGQTFLQSIEAIPNLNSK